MMEPVDRLGVLFASLSLCFAVWTIGVEYRHARRSLPVRVEVIRINKSMTGGRTLRTPTFRVVDGIHAGAVYTTKIGTKRTSHKIGRILQGSFDPVTGRIGTAETRQTSALAVVMAFAFSALVLWNIFSLGQT